MIDTVRVLAGQYHDSVTLMLAARDAQAVPGVTLAVVAAATPPNLRVLAEHGFEVPPGDATPNDVIVAIRAESDASAVAAREAIDRRLSTPRHAGGAASGLSGVAVPARSASAAARRDPALSVAFVSVPGRDAAYEVASAIEAGLHVFCFSNGVGIEQEVALKRRAVEQGVLLMGPDCGTAIVDGVGFGFANAVRPGPVGIVGASGTGIQQVSCLLDEAGVGISHAIGVGSRDLHAEVGGIMTSRALDLLAADPGTEVIVVISKPVDPGVARRVGAEAMRIGKPLVLCWLGPSGDAASVTSLEAAAARTLEILGLPPFSSEQPSVGRTPGWIRGLFCGGSLCYEAMIVVSSAVGRVASNIPLVPAWSLTDAWTSDGHTFVDFGEDAFTEGRLHPMIDPSLRSDRFRREAADPDVGVVVVDVVLGYGAHDDPAGELAPLVRRALEDRLGALTVVATVCGTDADPQVASSQAAALLDAGAVVARSAAHAGRVAVAATKGPEP